MNKLLQLPGYRVYEKLYQSQDTVVYRAVQLASGLPVVLKTPCTSYASSAVWDAYRREYAILQVLRGDAAVRSYNLITHQYQPVLLLEEFGAKPLSVILRQQSLKLTDKLELALRLAACIEQVHAQSVIHGDLTPSNVLVNLDMKWMKLADFGDALWLAKASADLPRGLPAPFDANLHTRGGTLAYMSPEQTGRIEREVDHRADLYSLGASLYELLTHSPPFVFEGAMELIHAQLALSPRPLYEINPEIPQVLSDIVLKCLAKNPEDRYQSARGVVADLQICLDRVLDSGTIEAFAIGQIDDAVTYRRSTRLYGREKEWEAIEDAFASVRNGSTASLLFSGKEGIGKSALLSEVAYRLQEWTPFVAQGSVTRDKQTVPYAALLEVFGKSCAKLLERADDDLAHWRSRMLHYTGSHASLMASVLPYFGRLTGVPAALPNLNEAGFKEAVGIALEQILDAFSQEGPFVLLLDDLQWADASSLHWLRRVFGQSAKRPCLLIASWQTAGHVSETEAVLAEGSSLLTLEKQAEDGLDRFAVAHIPLPPLDIDALTCMLAESLTLSAQEVGALAQVVLAKTAGHPFSVHQLLDTMRQQSLLSFDATGRRWQFDMAAISQLERTANVVEALTMTLDRLPSHQREVLGEAACIGPRFSARLLSFVRKEPIEHTLTVLSALLSMGLLERASAFDLPDLLSWSDSAHSLAGGAFRFQFAHAHIRHAAYQAVPELRRCETHWRIVSALLAQSGSEDLAHVERIHLLADHYNQARPLVKEASARYQAMTVNLHAGRKARSAGLFTEAVRYFTEGTEWLRDEDWTTRYDLAGMLYIERMRHAFLCNQYDDTLAVAEIILAHATTLLHRLEAHMCKINVFTMRYEYSSMMETARQALLLYGIELPQKVGRQAARAQYARVMQMMRDSDIEHQSADWKRADAAMQIILRILQVTSNSVTSDPHWMAFLWLKVAELSMTHGFCPDSAIGFLGSVHLANVESRQDIDEASRLGEFALKVVEHFRDEHNEHYMRARMNVLVTVGTSLNHWRNPLRTSVEALDDYFAGMRSIGAQNFAVLHSGCRPLLLFCCGTPLSALSAEAVDLKAQATALQLPFPMEVCRMLEEAAAALADGEASSFVAKSEAPQDAHVGFVSDIRLVQNLLQCATTYLVGSDADALSFAEMGQTLFAASLDCTAFLLPEMALYHALSVSAVLRSRQDAADVEADRGRLFRRLRKLHRMFRVWADQCPDNYQHAYLLVDAEYRSILGETMKAANLYDEAITLARASGCVHHEAMANECAAKHYLRAGKAKAAKGYLTDAAYLYAHWGAHRKVKQMTSQYPFLAAPAEATGLLNWPFQTPSSADGKRSLHALDLSTILRTSQAISSEIQLDRLLHTMLSLLTENAGAQKGYWILDQDGDWTIMAAAGTAMEGEGAAAWQEADTRPNVHVSAPSHELPQPLHNTKLLASRVVRYAIRAQEIVVLHDAVNEERFARDPYIVKAKAKSLLCFPIIKQAKVIAVLYLENNLATRVFTPPRVELMRLLSGQAAISIENARIYDSLDRLVQERTAQLRQTQQQVIQSEKLASLGQLTAGVAHEINNPVNFMVSSTTPLKRDIEELFDVLQAYEAILAEHQLQEERDRVRDGADLDYIKEEIQQLLRGIAEGGRRTAEIVKGLRTFSRLDEEEVKMASVLDGIDSTLTLLSKKLEPRIKVVRQYEQVPEIECYPGKLGQVYMNLLSNAIDAIAGEGQIEITVRQIKDHIELKIADTGVGMSSSVIRRIFEPFYTTKDVGVGTGLGLSISYSIIERHHGTIEVDSTPGVGTTFTITLPVAQSH